MSGKNPTRQWVADLLASFAGQENTLTIPRPYIALTGSVEAALLLSQIIYWSDRTKMADGWFAKTYAEWTKELALSKYQVSRATKILSEAGVETDVRKFKGAPTVHYRFNREVFSQWIVKKLDDPKFKNLTNDSEETDQSFTETTTEPTAKKRSAGKPRKSSDAFPDRYKDWTPAHIERYHGMHTAQLDTLVQAWYPGMFYRLTETPTSDARAFIELYNDLEKQHIPAEDYRELIEHTREANEWKTRGATILDVAKEISPFLIKRAKRASRVIPLHDDAPVMGILEERRRERVR